MLDFNVLIPAGCSEGLRGAESFLEFFRKAVKIHNVPTS
jgi:hypothetical protein